MAISTLDALFAAMGGRPRKSWKVLPLHAVPEADDGYYYHVTTKDRAHRIRREGLKLGGQVSQTMGDGFYKEWSKGKAFLTEARGVPYWAGRIGQHQQYNHPESAEKKLVAVRIPKSHIKGIEQDSIGTNDAARAGYGQAHMVKREQKAPESFAAITSMRALFAAMPRKPNKIVACAVRHPKSGKYYLGQTHLDALGVADEKTPPAERAPAKESMSGKFWEHGYVDSNGKFLDRQEAAKVAHGAKQIGKIYRDGLESGDLLVETDDPDDPWKPIVPGHLNGKTEFAAGNFSADVSGYRDFAGFNSSGPHQPLPDGGGGLESSNSKSSHRPRTATIFSATPGDHGIPYAGEDVDDVQSRSPDAPYILEGSEFDLPWQEVDIPVDHFAPTNYDRSKEDKARLQKISRWMNKRGGHEQALKESPLLVFWEGNKGVNLLDGWHRLHEARKRGAKTVRSLIASPGRTEFSGATMPITSMRQLFFALNAPKPYGTFAAGDGGGPEGPYRSPWSKEDHFLIWTLKNGRRVSGVVRNGAQPDEATIFPSHREARQFLKDNGFTLHPKSNRFSGDDEDFCVDSMGKLFAAMKR